MTRTALSGSSADRLVELENQVRSLRSDLQQLRTTATPTGAEGLGRPCKVVGPVTPGDDTFDVIWLDGEFTETKGANSVVWFDRQATSAGVAHTIDGSTLVADSVYYAHPWSDRWWIPVSAGGVTTSITWFSGADAGSLTNVSTYQVIPMTITSSGPTTTPIPGVTWHGTPDFVLEIDTSGGDRQFQIMLSGVAQGTASNSQAQIGVQESTTLGGAYTDAFNLFMRADTADADRRSYATTLMYSTLANQNFMRFAFRAKAGDPNCDLFEADFFLIEL